MERRSPFDAIPAWFAGLTKDFFIAARTLARRPILAIVPIVSSALGIGACSLIIGIANFALFRDLPVSDSVRLMSITGRNLKTGDVGGALSYLDFRDLTAARSFEKTAAYFPMMPAALSANGEAARRYWGTLATAGYFDVVRCGFLLGRGFDSQRDDAPGAAPVIVLSHQLWMTRFGGDPGVIGRSIMINRRSVTVIGVTRPGFRGTDAAMVSDFWLPFSMRDLAVPVLPSQKLGIFEDRDAHWLFVLGRLRDGITAEQANVEMEMLARRLAAAYPSTNRDRGLHVERAGQLVPAVRRAMLVSFLLLLAVSGLVLLTACANVANLLLARATARHKEIATRLAMGAKASDLVRQLLTESILLGLIGGALGYGIASYGANSFGKLRLPIALPVDFSVSLDYHVVLCSVALSVLTGLLFGLAPALHAVRQDLVNGLKSGSQQSGPARWWRVRNLLVIGQISISVVLLACAGLFFRSLESSKSADTGMRSRNVALFGFDPLVAADPAAREKLLENVLQRAGRIPGVESAALTSTVPLSLAGVSGSVMAEERRAEGNRAQLNVDIFEVSSRFFDTLGIALLAGEDFRSGKVPDDTVILNRTAAQKLFPGRNPIGARVVAGDRVLRVIGIVATTKSRTIVEEPRPCIFRPLLRDGGTTSITGLTLAIRTDGNPAGYLLTVSAALRESERGLALFDVRTMDEHLASALILQRAGAFLFGMAGLVGLMIATVGVYGLISFLVACQTKEIGIRMALGARRGQVLASTLRKGLSLTATGCVVGIALVSVLTRGIANLLYGVSPTDHLTLVAVPVFLLATALAACLVPAIHAARVSPAISIRHE